MDVAKHTDLLGLLPSLGYTLKRIGSYYTTAEMDSIRIRDPTRWKRYSTGQGGDAITFLQEFCGMRFPEAVDYLLAYHGRSRDSPDRNKPIPRPKPPPPREKPPFVLPPANPDQRRVFAYLRKRGIAPKVIRTFMEAGLLYEDAQYHNCVFVGRDGSGQPRFASKRGTCDQGGSGFKRDVLGSDKKIGFRLPCDPEIEEVAVYEAPIDLMSFCTLCPEVHSNAVALCGLYSGPLDTYLQDHPHIKSIHLLLDNDESGITAAKEMREKYRADGYEVELRVPKHGKDWNAQLKYKLTGVLEEVKKPQKKENPTKKEEIKPMANLGKLVSDKTAADTQWREQRQADKETASALRDASVTQITGDPEKFARYLELQGDNPSYSAGNVALVMIQLPEAAIVHTRSHWKDLGRFVLDPELNNGASIFTLTGIPVDSYEVTEISVPDPYVVSDESTQTIWLEAGDEKQLIFDNLKQPLLRISKVEKGTNPAVYIPNTNFLIEAIDGDYRHNVTTGAEGWVELRVAPGSYRITEQSVPEPYCISGDPAQTISLNGGDEKEIIFENLKKPELTISKIDADSGDPVPGTVFTVKAINGDYQDDWTTGPDGKVSLRIAPGTYQITEKSVPAPYYLPDKDMDRVQTISLNPGDEKTLVFRNHKAPELTIYKEDSVAGAPIEGAKFHVTYTSNGESADAPASVDFGYFITDANGEIKLHEKGKKLYPGEYTVTEVEPAPGFQMKEPTTQKVIIRGGESKTLTFQNEPLNGIVVEKARFVP